MSACAVSNCEREAKTRSWCRRHYRRWLRYGNPEAGGSLRHNLPLEERFWLRVKKGDGCWEWQGSRHVRKDYGYGQITATVNGVRRPWPTHRIAWELTQGPIPDGMYVCHHCDNPPCVRPDHLFLGTQSENIQDMWDKGRR